MAEHIYRPDQRPDVEVLVDGTWWPGELRGWWDRDGRRIMDCSWRNAPGMTRISSFTPDQVRAAPEPLSRSST